MLASHSFFMVSRFERNSLITIPNFKLEQAHAAGGSQCRQGSGSSRDEDAEENLPYRILLHSDLVLVNTCFYSLAQSIFALAFILAQSRGVRRGHAEVMLFLGSLWSPGVLIEYWRVIGSGCL